MEKYVIVLWPDIQEYMERDDFQDEAIPILDERSLTKYGSSAYFVPEEWVEPKTLLERNGDFFKETTIF